jgi:Family of unknown function (DUF5681)
MPRIPPKPFKPGQSGNPKGRPPGSGKVAKLRESIEQHVPSIIEALVQKALMGDAGAARVLIERVIPPLKAAELPTPIALPATGLSDQGRAILDAAGSGTLAPGQAGALLSGLGALAKLIETTELVERIKALEQKHAKP